MKGRKSKNVNDEKEKGEKYKKKRFKRRNKERETKDNKIKIKERTKLKDEIIRKKKKVKAIHFKRMFCK